MKFLLSNSPFQKHHHHPDSFDFHRWSQQMKRIMVRVVGILSILLILSFFLFFTTNTAKKATINTNTTTRTRRDLQTVDSRYKSESSIGTNVVVVGVSVVNVSVVSCTDNNCTAPPLEQDQVKVLSDVSGKYVPKIRWADSYSVGNICHCDTNFDQGVANILIHNTPIGSITIEEIMKYLPVGPGRITQPIYNDLQCGNGPNGPNEIDEQQQHCPGRVDHGIPGCGVVGPQWDFTSLQCTTKIFFGIFSVPGKKVRTKSRFFSKSTVCSCSPVVPFYIFQRIQQFLFPVTLDYTC